MCKEMAEECCKKLKIKIHFGEIDKIGNEYFIYGKPRSAHDGGGHYNDMTDSFQINFCPFCGKDLR